MSGDLWPAQQALHAKLLADANMQALLGNPLRLYDQVPHEPVFPYATYGEMTAASFDTKERYGLEQSISFYIFSHYRGRKEVKDIMAALFAALNGATLSVSGAQFVDCRFLSAATVLSDDGLTQQGIMRFRILTQTL